MPTSSQEPPVALVTGTAGFIGFHVARTLVDLGWRVVGLDGMTAYYDVQLKRDRLRQLGDDPNFTAHEFMLEDNERLSALVAETKADVIVHLAAQAGVRYSIDNPRVYIESNVVGTFNLLDAAVVTRPRHFLMASTSSVYGAGEEVPFAEGSETSRPLSLYAATKKATEVIAHSYAHIHHLPITAFRFFTVYGPWGRPDMALFKFVSAILADRPIDIYGHGKMSRDFTYIDDLVAGIVGLMDCVPSATGEKVGADDTLAPGGPFRTVNIGASRPVGLEDFVTAIENALGRTAKRNYLDMQPGDVPRTYADTGLLRTLTGDRQSTPLEAGVAAFVSWYRSYFGQQAQPSGI